MKYCLKDVNFTETPVSRETLFDLHFLTRFSLQNFHAITLYCTLQSQPLQYLLVSYPS